MRFQDLMLVSAQPNGGGWSPANLGGSLFAYWDAERTDLIGLSGANVTTWTDSVSGIAATQATSGFKPVWANDSFNGHAGITFDGTDDMLLATGTFTALPNGSDPCEIWVLVNQTDTVSQTTSGYIFLYGDAGSNNRRSIARIVQTGVHRAQTRTGTGGGTSAATNGTADFSGYHIADATIDPTTTGISVDGNTFNTVGVVPNTTRTNVAIGSVVGLTNFFKGTVNKILVTSILAAPQRALLIPYLKAIGGIA
jgi:hypothetical protein